MPELPTLSGRQVVRVFGILGWSVARRKGSHIILTKENHKDKSMLDIKEIKASIESLPENEFAELRRWFSEKDWQKWDEQIEADAESGKLDFLIEEALDEKRAGKLKRL